MRSYRECHMSPGYAQIYERTFTEGYYAQLWRTVERPLVQSILADLAARGARRSFDFACGTGRILALHDEVFDDVVGYDIATEMAALARIRCPCARIVVGDLTRSQLEEVPRDRQVGTAFRFFLNAEPELRNSAMAALRNCIADGGYLVADFHMNARSQIGYFYRLRNAVARRTINNVIDIEEAIELFRNHGFDVEGVHWYGLWPRVGWHLNALNRLLLSPAEALGRKLPSLRKYSQNFILVGRRR